jgi:hypothetical protein
MGEPNEEALTLLAKKLYETMERLDPPTDMSAPDPNWANLGSHSREFYISCVEALLLERETILSAFADDDIVLRRVEGQE